MNKVILIGRLTKDPELRYHKDNEDYLNNIIEEINMIVRSN